MTSLAKIVASAPTTVHQLALDLDAPLFCDMCGNDVYPEMWLSHVAGPRHKDNLAWLDRLTADDFDIAFAPADALR